MSVCKEQQNTPSKIRGEIGGRRRIRGRKQHRERGKYSNIERQRCVRNTGQRQRKRSEELFDRSIALLLFIDLNFYVVYHILEYSVAHMTLQNDPHSNLVQHRNAISSYVKKSDGIGIM